MSFPGGSIVLAPGLGRTNSVLDDSYTYKVVGKATGGNYALVEATLVGDGPPPHIHKTEEEAFYIVDGELTVQVGEHTVHGTAGSFVLVPRGVVHTFKEAETPLAKVLVLNSPARFEQFFEEIAGPPDMEKIMAMAKKYNLEIVEPNAGT